jgi:hypothetical protein
MTQEATPVGGEATPAEPTADYFEQMAAEEFGIQDEPAEGEQAEPADEADDEPEIEEEADDLPPIDPPVSWDAEAKAKFAELPRDAQEVIAKRESERERFVQQKSQEAARARQEIEQAAHQQLASYDRQVAEQLAQYAAMIEPQRPNPMLAQTDPATFYAMQQRYEDSLAQRQQLQQQAHEYAQQAQAREAQAEQALQAEQHRIIVENFPEFVDPTSGPKLRAELTAVAKELGYPDELVAQARATDILAMKKVADLKVKADKYDALMSKKMEKVRAARGLPRVATPGVAHGSDQLRARSAQAALDTALSSKDRNVQGEAFYRFLEKTGQVK